MVEDMPADTADVVDSHKQQVAALTKEVASCRREIDSLNRQLELASRFSYKNIVNEPNLVPHYTGLRLRHLMFW